MFNRKAGNNVKTTVAQFGFRIFFIHVINVIVMIVAGMLVENLKYIGIPVSNAATPITVTIVCFTLYMLLVYLEGWRTGQRDGNLVAYKHIAYNNYKPLLAALASQLPGLALALLAVLPGTHDETVRYLRYYYLNFNYFLLSFGESFKILYFIPAAFPLIAAPLAYHLGFRGIRLLDRLMFSKTGGNGGGTGKNRR
jgi:hypothetical protein